MYRLLSSSLGGLPRLSQPLSLPCSVRSKDDIQTMQCGDRGTVIWALRGVKPPIWQGVCWPIRIVTRNLADERRALHCSVRSIILHVCHVYMQLCW